MLIIDKLINKILKIYIENNYQMEGIVSLAELKLSPNDAHEHATTTDYFDLIKILLKLRVWKKLLLIWVVGRVLRLLSSGFFVSKKYTGLS